VSDYSVENSKNANFGKEAAKQRSAQRTELHELHWQQSSDIMMRAITNSYHDFRILNVSKRTRHPEQRGPFMAIQEGSDPNDPQMRECTFVLTRRGTWMHCYLFLMLPTPLRRQVAVFDKPQDILALAEELSPKPVAIETARSLHELIGSSVQALADDDPTSQTLLTELKRRKHGLGDTG
jgi:hypothetical protein